MKRLSSRGSGIWAAIFIAILSLAWCNDSSWAAVPTAAEWQALKDEHGIPSTGHAVGKSLRNYHRDRNAAQRTRAKKGTQEWIELVQQAAKSSGLLEKKLRAYRKEIKRRFPEKRDFLREVSRVKKEVNRSIITFDSYLVKFGGGGQREVAYALKAYLRNYKMAAKKINRNSTKDEICAVYTREYRGIQALVPELKKKFPDFQGELRQFEGNHRPVAQNCASTARFDADEVIEKMQDSVEQLKTDMARVLR